MGTLLVAAQHHPSETSLRVLKVNPFMAKSRTVHAEFEKQTGSEWNVEYTRLAKLKEGEKQEWEKRNSVAIVFTLRMIWTKGGTLYEKRDNGLIGIQNWKFWKARFRKQSRVKGQGSRVALAVSSYMAGRRCRAYLRLRSPIHDASPRMPSTVNLRGFIAGLSQDI